MAAELIPHRTYWESQLTAPEGHLPHRLVLRQVDYDERVGYGDRWATHRKVILPEGEPYYTGGRWFRTFEQAHDDFVSRCREMGLSYQQRAPR